MAYDIRLMKLVTGELIIGKYDADKDCLNEVATLQSVPTQQGVQMMLLPYGYPFEPDFTGSIEGKNFLYRYANTADASWGYIGLRAGRDWTDAGRFAARAASWCPR